ncbi:hypothetical protein OIU77_012957 [Salix suchowensis]|uniref:PH domain-containing protein n=1 Tax=Salix suchowensis TaxID=1278906 RepID=A0ABQ9A5H5_9ROSI|nr:hypothetical protein OIU77_012957 [Salix suchowensis]
MGSKEDMQEWLLSVGIISPVTKESAGAMYHQQLSCQGLFRLPPVLLTIRFCQNPPRESWWNDQSYRCLLLFNRARGTGLYFVLTVQ